MIVSIFVLMLLFGLCATGIGVVVIAIATRKLWLIPAVGAVALFGLMGLGLIASVFVARAWRSMESATIEMLPQSPSVVNSVSFPTQTVVPSPPNFIAYSQSHPAWRINLTWLVILGVVLAFVVGRRLFAPHPGHGA